MTLSPSERPEDVGRLRLEIERLREVVKEARHMVYDGMSEANWHRLRRAIEAMERTR